MEYGQFLLESYLIEEKLQAMQEKDPEIIDAKIVWDRKDQQWIIQINLKIVNAPEVKGFEITAKNTLSAFEALQDFKTRKQNSINGIQYLN